MKRARKFLKIGAVGALAGFIFADSVAQQQPVVTHPSTSSVQVTPRTPNNPYGSAANAATGMKVPNGTITGYVYWQTSGGPSSGPNSCQGLSATVSTVSKVSPQTIGTTNTFTSVGPMTDGSSLGTPTYMVCSYAFQKMPEKVYLKVQVSAQASQFSPAIVNAAPFQINGGPCNSTPQGTLSFILGGGEMLCGDNAYNINVKLTASASAIVRSPGTTTLLQSAGGVPHGLLSQPSANTPNGGATSTTTGTATLLHPAPMRSTLPDNTKGTLTGNSKGVGGSFTGGVRPGVNGGFTGGVAPQPISGTMSGTNFVPKMPPMNSDPKRDAAPPADASTKAQINSKLRAQLTSARLSRTAIKAPAPTNVVAPEIQALQKQKSFLDSLRTRGVLTKGSLATAQAPNTILRSDPPANSNPMLHAPQPNQICLNPEIRAVNGQTSGVTFTQDPQYNDYIISGCRFGSQAGQVYLSGAITGGRINLVVKQWSDTQIEAVVQPGLQGVLDGWPDLFVAPAVSATPVKFPNCRFYAQRQSVILPSIPQQYVTLANVTVGDGTHGGGTMYCPGPDLSHLFPCIAFNAGPPLDGVTNGHDHRNDPSQQVSNAVDRDGGQDDFSSGEDVYDLSYMAPGFEIDYPDVFWYAWTFDVCEGWGSDAYPKKPGDSVGYYTEGYYNFYKKTNTKIVVGWGVDHCAWRWLGMFRVDDWYNSGYSLQVHVKGPIGIDPWTGHATSSGPKLGEKVPTNLVRMQ